jgi:hypothetical protein
MGQTTGKSFGGVGLTSAAGVAASEIADNNDDLFMILNVSSLLRVFPLSIAICVF